MAHVLSYLTVGERNDILSTSIERVLSTAISLLEADELNAERSNDRLQISLDDLYATRKIIEKLWSNARDEIHRENIAARP